MIPYKSILKIDKTSKQAIYLQLGNQLIELIKSGILAPKTKLPSSRVLAEIIGLHRKTIVACYDELLIQGWLESIPKKGTYVHSEIPILKSSPIGKSNKFIPIETGFQFQKKAAPHSALTEKKTGFTYLDDGLPDVRLTPIKQLSQIYRSVCNSRNVSKHLGYGSTFGNFDLRKTLVKYLNETRGIRLSVENIIITRGSQMGIHLSAQLLIKPGDIMLVGSTNYVSADHSFQSIGARLIRIPVDKNGIDTKVVEAFCKKNKIKGIYITSHHHHPTTKTLSAERRLHLLNLAYKYKFAILEDDYDYDFHYNHAPILPLASHDIHRQVIYIGSLCKTVAPNFRIGYIVAAKEFIEEAANRRRYLDRQGDAILELAFSQFIKSGSLNRHVNKTIKIYRKRRNFFADQLEKLKVYFEYEIPAGGMAYWIKLKSPYKWRNVEPIARKYKLEIGQWQRYDNDNNGHNSIRIGFASHNEAEIKLLFTKLRKTMLAMGKN